MKLDCMGELVRKLPIGLFEPNFAERYARSKERSEIWKDPKLKIFQNRAWRVETDLQLEIINAESQSESSGILGFGSYDPCLDT